MAKERTQDRWVPKLNGKTYCSSACGYGCTKALFDKTNEQAAKCVASLGKGWSSRVWENLGWHWEVYRDGIYIYPDRDVRTGAIKSYWVTVGHHPRIHATAKNIRAAAREVERQLLVIQKEATDNLHNIAKLTRGK